MNPTTTVTSTTTQPACWGCGSCNGAQRLEWINANPNNALSKWLTLNPTEWPKPEVIAVVFPNDS